MSLLLRVRNGGTQGDEGGGNECKGTEDLTKEKKKPRQSKQLVSNDSESIANTAVSKRG